MTNGSAEHMPGAYASSIARQLCHGRTDGRTNEESWLSTRDLLTFRNARAHIRKFPSADFGGSR